MSKVHSLVANNQAKSKRDIAKVSVQVTGIVAVAEDKCPKDSQGNIIPKSMIITEEHGTFWCLTNSVINKPDSFVKSQQCSLTLEAVEIDTKEGKKEVLNVLRAEFELSVSQKIMIAGTSGAVLTF